MIKYLEILGQFLKEQEKKDRQKLEKKYRLIKHRIIRHIKILFEQKEV